MESISSLLHYLILPFREVLFYHKKKLLFFILSIVAFIVVLFPFSDLSFFAQEKANESLKGSGYQVSFNKINFNLFPLGFKATDFNALSNSSKSLKIGSIVAHPNLGSLLKLQPGGSLRLESIFNGNLNADFSLMGETEEKQKKFSINTQVDNISLKEILDYANQKISLEGKVNGQVSAQGEESFRKQPEGDFKFNFTNVSVPERISTPAGPISLPEKIKWKNSNLFGKIDKGRILIENGTLGTKNAPVNGRYKGSIDCVFVKSHNGVAPNCSRYDIKVELDLDQNFQKNFASNFSSLITDKMVNKTVTPQGGMRYLFSVKGNMKYGAPSVQKLSSF